ncbi:MAG: SpoIIE family protein phosphatase [Pseudonocardia sp.]
MLLYTDGLVERRGENLDDGLARLAAVAAQHTGAPPAELVTMVLDRCLDGAGSFDDIAVVVARLRPGPLDQRLPARPEQLSALRWAINTWATAAALPAVPRSRRVHLPHPVHRRRGGARRGPGLRPLAPRTRRPGISRPRHSHDSTARPECHRRLRRSGHPAPVHPPGATGVDPTATGPVTYLSSAGVDLLVAVADAAPGRLRLMVDQAGPVARILGLTGLDRHLPVVPVV